MSGLAVKHGLLGILAIRPRHGYELKTEFDLLTGGLWDLNVGQIYSTLDRMLKDGLVSLDADEPGDDRKVYQITAAGRADLEGWLRRPPLKTRPLRDELFVRLGLLLERDPPEALELLDSQRRIYHLQLAQLTREKIALSRTAPATRLQRELLLDAAILHTEADVRWLEACEEKIRRLACGERSE